MSLFVQAAHVHIRPQLVTRANTQGPVGLYHVDVLTLEMKTGAGADFVLIHVLITLLTLLLVTLHMSLQQSVVKLSSFSSIWLTAYSDHSCRI